MKIHQQHLVRSLGFVDVLMIGIAGLVGGAIFVLTGPAIGLAGGSVIIAFIINGIITLFTAMVIRRTRVCHTRSWWRLSVGQERITKAKCFHKWLDGMVCTYCRWQLVRCRIWIVSF